MKQIANYITIFCLAFISLITANRKGFAQDFHLSQYEASPMLLNPAMTGMFNGDFRAVVHYRSQWSSIISNPFQSSALSLDTRFNHFGFGGFITNTNAGVNRYSSTTMVLSGSYDYKFSGNPHHHISIGVQGGGIFKSINTNSITFEDQYDPANGGTFINSTNETFTSASSFLPEVSAGIIYYYTNTNKRVNPFAGFSTQHLTQPNESLIGTESNLPMRNNAHAGIKVHINKKFQFLMHGLGMKQGNVNEIMFSWVGYSYFEKSDISFSYGLTRRTNNDAVIVQMGVKYKKFQYRISYDLNTSNLQTVSNGRGGFEFSLVFINSKVNPIPVRTCPNL
ncbi:MAG: PorP/SprF family type IX secretion system membrane protein [Flavobacteriales bacterium]|nr:PorP/SprF family type IX secretion system membrane protein [Flavobacteriales bacterium]MCB9197686.1 PorP/SprF family type IX secretion system membrane protein [Flavobacteriales bacterium]